MGETDHARRQIAASRERLGRLAVELSQQLSPDHLKAAAKDRVSAKTTQLKETAQHRLKDTTEKAMSRTQEFGRSPAGMTLIGGAVGAITARMISKRLEARGDGWQPELGEEKEEKIGDRVEAAKHRAGSALSNVRERAQHLRERVPSAGELRHQTSGWYSRNVDVHPLLFAAGAAFCGMLLAALIPVTERERRMMEPAKRKAEERLSGITEQVEERIRGGEEHQQEPSDIGVQASDV